MIPVASFRFVTNGLRVFFEDQSTEAPTVWAWTFGDGNVSVVQNPTHAFLTPGTYPVTLVSTNLDGESEPYSFDIIATEDNSVSVHDMIGFELPSSIVSSPALENYYLNNWRVYLQCAFNIEDDYLEDDSHYTHLQNLLLAKLVVYDYLIKLSKDYMASTMGAGGGGGSTGGAQGGNVKKIETGPTTAEWYSGSDTLEAIFKPNSSGQSAFDELTTDICGIAQHPSIRVKLPMCCLHGIDPMVPIKSNVQRYVDTNTFLSKNPINL